MTGFSYEMGLNTISETTALVCRFCGSSTFKPGISGPDFRVGIRGTYTLYECTQCGLAYLPSLPAGDAMELHYPDWLWRNEVSRSPSAPAKLNVAFDTLRHWHAQPGSLLDIGCGPGDFVLIAQKAGWRAQGIEVSHTQVDYARSRGVDVTLVPDFMSYQPDERYDAITFNHVLEHVPEPKGYLTKAISLLHPNGLLLIAVPNYRSLSRHIFGKYWTHLDLPRHIFHYSPMNLTRTISQLGCEVLQMHYHDPQQNSLGIRDSVRRWVVYGIMRSQLHPVGRDSKDVLPQMRGVKSPIIYLYHAFGKTAAALTEQLRNADTFTLVARLTSQRCA